MADLVERLRGYRPRNDWGDGVEHTICNEAADEIARLRDALVKISSPTQTEGLLWWQIEARTALDARETTGGPTK